MLAQLIVADERPAEAMVHLLHPDRVVVRPAGNASCLVEFGSFVCHNQTDLLSQHHLGSAPESSFWLCLRVCPEYGDNLNEVFDKFLFFGFFSMVDDFYHDAILSAEVLDQFKTKTNQTVLV